MNILDMMNKITELSKPIVETKEEKTTHKGGTATTDEKGTKHKGKYGTDYQGDEDDDKTDDYGKKKKAKPAVAAPAEKRGRGRPAKGSDKDGNVMKPDWSAFGAKKDVKLPKYDKNKTTKHSLKDWIENLDSVLNEAPAVIAKPAPGAVSLSTAAEPNKVIGTATGPAAQAISQGVANGTVNLDNAKALKEVERNHMGETEYHGYYKWRVACRKAGATEFVGDKDIDEGHDASGQAVGEWDGVVGTVYGDAHKANPAQDPYDQDDPAPMEEGDMPPRASLASPMSEAKKAKPDFLDKDKDGNKKEPFKKAVKDAKNPADSKYDSRAGRRNGRDDVKAKQVEEGRRGREPSNSISAPTETGTKAVYKGTPEYAQEKKRKADQEKQQKNTIHNDKMAYRKTTAVEEGKDEGKPGKNFAKIAKSAGKEYGSKAAGERVAGAVKAKLAKQGKLEEGKVKELSMDLEDRTMKDAEFKKKYGKSKADMQKSLKPADAKKPASKIKESILRESRETLQHIINRFKHETKNFVAGGDLDEDLYDALYDYYCDQGEMPYGTMKARDGDPYEWVTQRFDSDVLDHDVPMDEAVNPSLIPAVTRKGQGVNFPASLQQVNQNDSLSHLPNVRAAAGSPWGTGKIADKFSDKAAWGSPKTGDVQFESWDNALTSLLNEGINVTANTGLGDGPDSVSISATDEDAQKLLAIVKSAGLGMFGGEAHSDEEGSPQMSIQGQENPEADIDVVDDHDGMLSLIRKMTGQGDAPAQSNAEVEVDEEETPDQGEEVAAENTPTFGGNEPDQEGSSEEEVQQATDKLEKVHDAWSQAGSDDGEESDEVAEGEPKGGEDLSHEDTKDMSQDEVDHALDKDLEDEEPKEKEEELDEAFANGADDTFESDLDYMLGLAGGLNKPKATGQSTVPVVASQTDRLRSPMKESTDLLKDWKTLSGIK